MARVKDASLNRAVIAELDPGNVGDKLSRLFSARFKEVRMVESPEAARKRGCDLAAAADLSVAFADSFGQAPAAPEPVAFFSDVDRPKFKSRERPDDFAVVVGVEKYSNDLPAAPSGRRWRCISRIGCRAI